MRDPSNELLTTTCPLTAYLCGYDKPVDHTEDGDGFTLFIEGEFFILNGPDGEVQLHRLEAAQVAKAIIEAMPRAERAARK